jgi:hypothetical protein
MKKILCVSVLIALCVFVSATAISAFAADTDDLLLYMGDKIEYVWKDNSASVSDSVPGSGDIDAGGASAGSPGYIFTTKETAELVAQALSGNHASVTLGFARQLPMRDLLKLLTAVKSAHDILVERGREDLLALAYLGGYIAPEHEYISMDPTGETGDFIPVSEAGANTPSWASNGDLGGIGSRAAFAITGEPRLRSVYGESYMLGSVTFGTDETVFDTVKGANVYALFNGYVSYVGSSYIEMRSYDQRVIVRYGPVEPLTETIAGKSYAQGELIGTTSGYALGVSIRVDDRYKNLLEVYTQALSQQWFNVWDKKNPGAKDRLILGSDDTYYHYSARELSETDPSSYTNPDAYGINPYVSNSGQEAGSNG